MSRYSDSAATKGSYIRRISTSLSSAPALPLAKQPGQRLLVRPLAAEQLFRARRRSRSSVEQRDVDLAARERLVQHGQIADDQSEEREPDTGFDHDQRAPHSSNRRDVAEAQREERLAAQIEMVGEGAAAADVEGAPRLEQRERRDETGRPHGHQHQQR